MLKTIISMLAVGVAVGLFGAALHASDEAGASKTDDKAVPPTLNFTMKSLSGQDVNLSKYQGKVVMIVNTASKCGYTPQYKDLEALYRKYQDKGFVILGFPANDFGHQEPGTDQEIAQFCHDKFDVTFDMFSKISVKGSEKAPLYKLLTESATDPKFPGEIKWNFEKFLIAKDGTIVARYPSKVKPLSDEVVSAVEAELAK
jgi:glutathione peroxidase